MTLLDKAHKYAQQHPQEATLSWIDGSERTYTADKAARLCGVPRIAACLMGASANDTTLAGLLNQLIDQGED